jgi:uncharacterized protein (DUF2236 family)
MATIPNALAGRVRSALAALVVGDDPGFVPAPDVDGLLPSGAVSRRVVGDAAALVGGVRALLLQACHPVALQGVLDHSSFADDPLGRLHRTVAYVGVCTYGSAADADRMARRVRSAHDAVAGITPAGRQYRAGDPDLLSFVHVALVDSLLATHDAYGSFRLSAGERDAFVAEQAVGARLLGADDLPLTATDLADALAGHRRSFGRMTGTSRTVQFLAAPPLPLWARAAYGGLFAGAVATLGYRERVLLRLPLGPVASLPARATCLAGVRTLRLVLTERS